VVSGIVVWTVEESSASVSRTLTVGLAPDSVDLLGTSECRVGVCSAAAATVATTSDIAAPVAQATARRRRA
jgi:hypothetical protein